MKIAYFDCASGISGDMTLGALIDAGVDLSAVQAGIDSLGIAGLRLSVSEVRKNGFRALQLQVEHQPEHAHRHLHHITDMIDASALSERQKDLARRIFTRLGEAEARVHGTTIRKVHFHEVGAVDSIADIVGCAIAWDLLGAERAYASPIPTGQGFIQIAHGRCSIPAPATAELLAGIPIAPSEVQAELTTPTGAAIIATLIESFGPVPAMSVDRIGYGAGQRDLELQPNLLRILVGSASEVVGPTDAAAATQQASCPQHDGEETIWVLETNLDDVTGEVVGYCLEQALQLGALDAFTTAIQMKKNRPGVMLSLLCRPDQIKALEELLFRETMTLGVRRYPVSRRALPRTEHSVETPWGTIEGKLISTTDKEGGGQAARFSPEYESCRRIAQQVQVPLREVMEVAQRAFLAAEAK